MSWNQENLDIPAFDYYGTTITYRELPDRVNEYVCGLRAIGITEKDVVLAHLAGSDISRKMLSGLGI